MFRVMIRNIFFNSWILNDEKFETIESAKAEVEKRVNNGQRLTDIKIIKEYENVKVKVI